jgi:hypothetical protein
LPIALCVLSTLGHGTLLELFTIIAAVDAAHLVPLINAAMDVLLAAQLKNLLAPILVVQIDTTLEVVIVIIIAAIEDRHTVATVAAVAFVVAVILAMFITFMPAAACELIINLALFAGIALRKFVAALLRRALAPVIARVIRDIAEDAMATSLVELSALLFAAVPSVLALLAVITGCENALEEVSESWWRPIFIITIVRNVHRSAMARPVVRSITTRAAT